MASTTSGAVCVKILVLLMSTQGHTRLSLDVSEGEDALLPCVYTGSDPTVIWKDPKDKTMFIINRTEAPDRVETFPQMHHRGNFSIVLQDVRLNDSGKYECKILRGTSQIITLKVSEKKPKQEYGARGDAVVTRPWDLHMIALLLSVSFLLQTK